MKKILVISLTLISVILLSSCDTRETLDDGKKDDQQEEVNDELLELTIEQLTMYNGEDGNPSYIAVNGVIYDITGVSAWSSGTHNGGVAGTDISNLINGAPHGETVLDNLEVVGGIIE